MIAQTAVACKRVSAIHTEAAFARRPDRRMDRHVGGDARPAQRGAAFVRLTYILMVCNIAVEDVVMIIASYYPVLATTDVAAAARFYEATLGFVPRYVSEWYVHLGHRDHDFVALALVAKDHDSVPPLGRVPSQGLFINFEVEDVEAEYARVVAAGAEVEVPLKDEPWGQRHFILRAPDGVLVDVITPIPPRGDDQSAYVGAPA